QAEDGIRDLTVTGVQTCALPIYSVSIYAAGGPDTTPYLLLHAKLYVFATRYLIPTLAQLCLKKLHQDLVDFPLTAPALDGSSARSEERRVGKECRYRSWTHDIVA